MTVVVGFLCSDGVVIAADSMISSPIAHLHGQKIAVLPGPQLFALAGDLGQNARFRTYAELNHNLIPQQMHASHYPRILTQAIVDEFISTGIGNSINAAPILAFAHGDTHHCCVFESQFQYRMLDADNYFCAVGSGKMSADPFLRYLTDIFCPEGQPSVSEAIFLATWAVEHVITVNPGGVAAPLKLATFTPDPAAGAYLGRLLGDPEIEEHRVAVSSAAQALRNWRISLGANAPLADVDAGPDTAAAQQDVDEMPQAPQEGGPVANN
ncbi:hypothetical protein [Ensifer canadensis]